MERQNLHQNAHLGYNLSWDKSPPLSIKNQQCPGQRVSSGMYVSLKFLALVHRKWVIWIQRIDFSKDVRKAFLLFFNIFHLRHFFSWTDFTHLAFKPHVITFSKFRASLKTFQMFSEQTCIKYQQLLNNLEKEMLLRNLQTRRTNVSIEVISGNS